MLCFLVFLLPDSLGLGLRYAFTCSNRDRPSWLGLFVAVDGDRLGSARPDTGGDAAGTPSDATARIVAAAQARGDHARRGGPGQGPVPVRRTAEDEVVQPSVADLSARRHAPGRSDRAAARRRRHAALGGAEPGRVSEGHRDHARRRSARERAGRAGAGGGGPRGSPRTSTSSPSWARRRRRRHGCCSSAVTTSRST